MSISHLSSVYSQSVANQALPDEQSLLKRNLLCPRAKKNKPLIEVTLKILKVVSFSTKSALVPGTHPFTDNRNHHLCGQIQSITSLLIYMIPFHFYGGKSSSLANCTDCDNNILSSGLCQPQRPWCLRNMGQEKSCLYDMVTSIGEYFQSG